MTRAQAVVILDRRDVPRVTSRENHVPDDFGPVILAALPEPTFQDFFYTTGERNLLSLNNSLLF